MKTTHLSNKYVNTLARIFQHPVSHNLEWHDVIALVEHLGTVEENEKGHLIFTVNGITQSFHRSPDKDVSEVHQILELRHLMENAGIKKNGTRDDDSKLRLVVAISQKETRVFRSEGKGSVPEHIHPYDPRGVLHHLNHSLGDDLTAKAPENRTYYEAIADTLVGAEEILLMGNGTGASSAMNHVKDFLETHHPEIARTIVGALKLDLEALTEGQLLQEARAFFADSDGLSTGGSEKQ